MASKGLADRYQGEDEFLRAHPLPVRHSVAAIWAMRAGLELSVGAGYAVIIRELLETGAEKPVLQLCCDAASDEIGHAQLCLDLAERLDGTKRDWPSPTSLHVPRYAGVEAGPMLATLHLVAMSCLNETIACTRLLEAIHVAKCPSAKLGLQLILSDEIRHARAGWAHLASRHVTDSMKRALSEYIPELIDASMTSLIEENASIPTEEFSMWGLPSVDDARAHAQKALREVVMPGFKHLGIAVSATVLA